jgi:capsular exopolysaccharide synthesis family protein
MASTIEELTFPPKWWIVVLLTTIATMGLTAGGVFLWELMDQRLKSPSDVKLVKDAELLGVLPDAAEDPSGNRRIERVVEVDPTGLMAEAFRQVRTAILSKMDRRGYKTLLVVGSQPGAGSSTVAHNLATSIALNGRRVLIVDANFRRPYQHKLMDVNNGEGLIDVLEKRASIDQVVRVAPETGLTVMPTGHAQDTPPEIFEGQAFRALLSQLETQFDLIIVDAPPGLLTTDSQLLARQMDAIAIVARAARDSRGMLGRILRRLDGQRADVLGVVLNGVQSSAGGYFRKSYREFYRYRNGDERGRDLATVEKREPVEQRA